MKALKRIVLFVILLICVLHIQGSILYKNDAHRYSLPFLEQLKANADSLCDENPKEAHNLYMSIAEAYKDEMNEAEKLLCATAFNNAGYLQFFKFSNFLAAWTDFSEGIDIAEKIGADSLLGTLHLNIGNVYANFEDSQRAMSHYKKSATYFYGQRDWERFQVTMFNVMLTGFHSCHNDSITMLVRRLVDEAPEAEGLSKVNKRFARAYLTSLKNDLAQAERYLEQSLDVLNSGDDALRYRSQLLTLLGAINLQQGNSRKAVERFRLIDSLLAGSDETDLIGINYQNMADAYKALSLVDSANYYRIKSFEITDSILTLSRLNDIRNAEANVVMQRTSKEMNEQIQHRKRLTAILAVTCVVVIIVSLLLAWIWRNYRALKQKNMVLYRKIQSEITAERVPVPEEPLAASDEAEEEKQKKQSAPALADKEKQLIYSEIVTVMESDAIFNSEFCIAMLAEKTGRSKRLVSQVINEVTGNSFSVILAEYRIREACCRLSNPKQFGHLTLETIGRELGFLSRSNFSTTFKKITGMTPRDYIKCNPAQ